MLAVELLAGCVWPGRRERPWDNRQLDYKFCAVPSFSIFNPDAAVVCFDDAPGDRQPHARPGSVPVTDVAIANCTKEFFKHAFANIRADARATIFDADDNCIVAGLF